MKKRCKSYRFPQFPSSPYPLFFHLLLRKQQAFKRGQPNRTKQDAIRQGENPGFQVPCGGTDGERQIRNLSDDNWTRHQPMSIAEYNYESFH
ncbi:hypothetical protein STEG23_009477 [Scotinomys teguina]